MGEGWTGALGTNSLATNQQQHSIITTPSTVSPDEYDYDPHYNNIGLNQISLEEKTTTPILAAAAGWGHSILISSDHQIYLSGRPHDFRSLLRLKRLPTFLRDISIQLTTHINDSGRFGIDPNNEEGFQRQVCTLSRFTVLEGVTCHQAVASAGISAIIDNNNNEEKSSGTLSTFGINNYGQAGVGFESRNVWTPTPVMGLSTKFALRRETLEQEYPVLDVALGLQHGLALTADGTVYTWGKAMRGQLGNIDEEQETMDLRPYGKIVKGFDDHHPVTKISAGFFHCAVLTERNDVFVWGKNLVLDDDGGKAKDALFPVRLKGLPSSLKVVDLACGSHHTSVLLEDGSVYGIGIGTDNSSPVLECAVEMIPPGIIEMPCRQFDAAFDRTVIVGAQGKQVLEVQLWSHDDLRNDAAFVPLWWRDLQKEKPEERVKMVKRGWLHSIIITDEKDENSLIE